MSKLKCTLFVLIMSILLASPLLVGCDFSFYTPSKLSAPIISLNEENECLVWDSVKNASGYDIYCNNQLADTIDAVESKTVSYELVALLGDSGEYVFEVVATSDSIYIANSDSSNSITYNYEKNEIVVPDIPDSDVDTETTLTYTVSTDGILSYIPLEQECKYVLYLYSNSTGLKTYDIKIDSNNERTSINLRDKYITKNEIYAIRLGYTIEGKTALVDDLKFYNPQKFGTYTSNIYLFDGYINDFYIENIQELKNVVYYTFINRMEEYTIKISQSLKDHIGSGIYQGYYIVDNMHYAIAECYNQFYETMSYIADNTGGKFTSQLSNSTEFKIKVSYGGVKECDTTIRPSETAINAQSVSDAYYEIKDFESLKEKYGDNYDNFVSDKHFLSTTVQTSEQLYWAVENKVTPVFNSKSSRAYTIYAKAKAVLREIISEDMTDYEKALSIFDWICINTNYDYTSYTTANGYSASIANYPTKIPCFYLEGVFMTGNAVCDGFSKAYSLMCNMLGIDAIRIVGNAKTGSSMGGHAWNKVLIDMDLEDEKSAEYYLVDITWTEIMSQYGEELTHTYFGLSDRDTASTHFTYSRRNDKFGKYAASNNLRYYDNQTFEYEDQEYNLVINNTDELIKMFDYMLVDNRGAMEVVVDYDYMLAEYEKVHGVGSYRSSNKVDKEYTEIYGKTYIKSEYYHATDTLVYHQWAVAIVGSKVQEQETIIEYKNYKLRENFAQQVMKPNKFQEQYIFIADDDEPFAYNNQGKKGLLYVLTQNLLIDSDGEIEHLVNYLDQKDIYGEFTLYVKDTILSTGTGNTYLEMINSLFNSYVAQSGIKIDIELVQTNTFIDSTLTASTYKMVVSEK